MKQLKAIFKSYKVDMFFMILIFGVCIWNIRDYDCIRSVDEFGYFGVAASLAGWDWKEMMATSNYYSFGYSLILVPLIWIAQIGISMSRVYKIVIVLNAFLLVGEYLLIKRVEEKVFVALPESLRKVAALAVSLYIANTVHMNSADPEIALRFLFWCILAVSLSFIQKPGFLNGTFLIILSEYIFAVHMRAIGVAIAAGVVITFYVVSHFKIMNKRLLFYMIAITAATIAIFWGVKSYVSNEIYINHYAEEKSEDNIEENKAVKDVNSIEFNLRKTKNLFSLAGVKDVGMSICGKLYYAFSATFLLVITGIIIVLCLCIRKPKISDWNMLNWYSFFVFLAFAGVIFVAGIYKTMPFYREGQLHLYPLETIAFGRYADFAVGGLMLLGIYGLYYVEQYIRQIAISVVCFLGLAWVVQYQFDMMTVNLANDKIANFRINQTPWFAVLSNGNINYFAYYAAAVSIAFFAVMVFAGGCKKRKKEMLTMVMLGVCFMWGAMSVHYSKEYNDSKGHRVYQIGTVVDIISATDENTQIYYIGSDYRDGGSDVEILQWRLGKRTIHVRTLADLDNDEMSSAILLCHSNNQEIMEALREEENYIFDSTALQVYAAEKGQAYEVMLQKAAEVE